MALAAALGSDHQRWLDILIQKGDAIALPQPKRWPGHFDILEMRPFQA